MLHRSFQERMHHRREGINLNKTSLLLVMFGEDLQHVPVELHGFSTVRLVDGSLYKLLILINSSLVNNGMWVHSRSLGSNVFSAELQPFIKGDDTSSLEIHGVEHLLPGRIFFLLSFVKIRISWSIAISPGHGSRGINQLGEGSLADKTIPVGVGVNKNLEQGVVEFRVRITLLVLHGLLHKPDEVRLGLVEGVDGCR